MKLTSMVGYVLEKQNVIKNSQTISMPFNGLLVLRRKCQDEIFNYAKLLSMPLTLGMFVPTDEDGNVLEDPGLIPSYELDKYRKALSNVIFEGFSTEENEYDNEGWFRQTVADIFIKEGKSWRIYSSAKNIENLTKRNLTITKSAITKYQI